MSEDFPQPNKELEAVAAENQPHTEIASETNAEQATSHEAVAAAHTADSAEAHTDASVPMMAEEVQQEVAADSREVEESNDSVEPSEIGDGATAQIYAAVDIDDEEEDPFDGASDDDDFDELDEDEDESEEDEDEEEFDDELEDDDDEEEDDSFDSDEEDDDESMTSGDLKDQTQTNSPIKAKRQRADSESRSEVDAYEPTLEADGDNDPSAQSQPKRDHSKHLAKFEPQRLAKILAASGLDARRKCEEYVTAGRVSVDGEVITNLAFRADPYSQKIELDGERIKLQRKVYFILNKPRGVVCSNNDPEGRPRVIDMFPEFFKERMFTIGRLDAESEGLILVTNDGELANRMAHPRYRVPKFYLCHVKGVPSPDTLAALKRGMYFDEGRFSVEGVRMKKTMGDSAYLDIVLNEGQNREIRRLLARVDHKVMRLKRVGFGPIRLGDMPGGAFRPLTAEESKLLKSLSEQRAHLDKTASRGRKPRGGKVPFGSKKLFGAKPGFASRGGYDKPSADEITEFPKKRSYAEKVRERQASKSQEAGGVEIGNRYSDRGDRGTRRPAEGGRSLGARPGISAQGGGYSQRPPREDRPPQRRLVEASDDESDTPTTSETRFDNRPRQGSYNRPPQSGYGDRPQGDRPQYGARPQRQYQVDDAAPSSQGDDDFPPPRRYGNRPQNGGQSGYGQRPQYGSDRPQYGSDRPQSDRPQYGANRPQYGANRPAYGEARPPRQYQSNDEGQSAPTDADFPPPRQYGNRPQQGGYNQRPQGGYSQRPQQGGYGQRPQYGNDRPQRSYQSDDSRGSNQDDALDNDSDFNGGRRRGNNEDDDSDFTPRAQTPRPPRREGGYSQRPPQGQGRPPQGRPPQGRYGSQDEAGGGGYSGQRRYGSQQQEGTGGGYGGQRRYGSQGGNTGERSGGYSGQRRPGGYRDGNQGDYQNQGDNQSGPPRGRGGPPVRAPRPMTNDGKEILEGKVTGYRTPPKEGLPRRPYKAVIGMKGDREKRNQRRKKRD